MERYSIICPCCEAVLTVDANTGSLLDPEAKKKITGSFEDLQGQLSEQKDHREQTFAQEMSSMKDRERLLEEKFQEALKRADTDSGFTTAGPGFVRELTAPIERWINYKREHEIAPLRLRPHP